MTNGRWSVVRPRSAGRQASPRLSRRGYSIASLCSQCLADQWTASEDGQGKRLDERKLN